MKIVSKDTADVYEMIHKANLISQGKLVDSVTFPSKIIDWCKDIVLSEHSTLEFVSFTITDTVRSDVVSQMVRHTAYHPRHVVQSFRPDWTHKDRPKNPMEERLYISQWNPKALIVMARQRLCNKAMKETRDWVLKLKLHLYFSSDNFSSVVGWAMVPECMYRGGCPFKKSCGAYDMYAATTKTFSIKDRYDKYLQIMTWDGKVQ